MRNPSDLESDAQDTASEHARQVPAPTADIAQQVPVGGSADAPQSGDELQTNPIIINR